MKGIRKRIGELLIEQRLATKEQLDQISAKASGTGKGFGQVLTEEGLVTEEKLTELLSGELGLPMISLSKYRLDPSLACTIPERMARRHKIIALSRLGKRLVVAMADPLDVFAIDDVKAFTQVDIAPVLSPETEIRRAIEQVYTNQLPVDAERLGASESDNSGEESLDTAVAMVLDETDKDVPIVQLLNLLVVDAMRRRASDIHLEPMNNKLRVRYRVDGKLIETHEMPRAIQNPLTTRLKILSGLDITEWRLPQDGRFKVRLEDREVDFRVSILPITHGGKAVLRLLDKSNLSIGLDNLGFMEESIRQFKEAVKRPYGMILVTGPTGSGKSTTLYSILNSLNEPTKNLITIEDPVEYQVEGMTQVQVNTEVGMTFANGLRSLLRQSPDIVMIGEIRDFETADIAMKSSLTGQLVFSTLHTNDAPSAVTRLIDMGVEPFLVASSVTLIQAQRLVRKLCTKCREPYKPPADLLKQIKWNPDGAEKCFRARGCRMCNGTGYKGRMGIIEVFQTDERIRELIVSRAQSWEIKKHAIEALGMTTLRKDGLRKVEAGLTSLEEVLSVTSEE